MGFKKMKTAPDLSNADSYIVIFKEGESTSLGISGSSEQLFESTYEALYRHKHLKSLFEAVIAALDDPEGEVYEPTPSKEIN